MRRIVFACVFASLLTATAVGQDAVEIKIDKPKVGDRVKHSREEKNDTNFTVVIGGNEMGKEEKKTKSLVYIEEVLAVPAGADRASKLTRTYEKARTSSDGEKTTLGIEGHTVLIEKKGDKFVFTVDGKEVEAESRKLLDAEFNKPEGEDTRDLFFPKKAVKPGESWKIDTKSLTKGLSGKDLELDEKKLEANGKLVKAYKMGDKQFGMLEITVSAPVTGLGPKAPIKVKSGSMDVKMTGDGCIDGTSPEGKSTMVMKLKIEGSGEGFELKGDVSVTETRISTLAPKKK